MPTEATPLVSEKESRSKRHAAFVKEKLHKHVVNPEAPTWESRTEAFTFMYLTTQTLKNHYWSLLACICSGLLCAHNDHMSQSIFDPLIFKSIFVVFGFAIGFRNMRANERRGMCLMSVRNICHAAWELLLLLPYDEHRPRMREQLLCALEALADHTMRVADRGNYKYALSGTEPADEEEESTEIHLGPTTLMAATLLALEDEMSRLQFVHSKHPEYAMSQKYQRTFWAKKLKFDEEHYNLVNYAIPSVSDAYVVLINSSLFLFGMVLPWGLHCNNVNIRGVNIMGAGTFLVINTIVVMWILLGLNTLASQHEDPFMPSYEMIDLRQHITMFRRAVEHYDQQRISLHSTPHFEDTVALHRHMTSSDGCAPEVEGVSAPTSPARNTV